MKSPLESASESVRRLNPRLFGLDPSRLVAANHDATVLGDELRRLARPPPPPPAESFPVTIKTSNKERRELPENRAARSAEYRREADLQAACERELRKRGIPFLHLSPRAHEKEGWPDLTFPGPGGRFVGVELKAAGGKVSERQRETLEALSAKGAKVRVVRTLDGFLSLLEIQPEERNHGA